MAEYYGDSLICCVENPIDSWVMDSRVSFHACHKKEIMRDFTPYNGTIFLADGKILKITGIGDVALIT